MTDKYGSEPHPDEAGHDQHMADENETWTGEPPVDDFHAGEEAATVSEEIESAEDTVASQENSSKKSLALPIIAGVGGLLFLGAVLYWQFGASSSNSMPVASVPPLSNPMAPPVATTDAPVSTPAAADISTDISNLKPAAPDVAPTTGLTPVAADAVVKPVPNLMVAPSDTATAAPLSDATAVALSPKPATITPAPTPSAVVAATPLPPTPTSVPVIVAPPSVTATTPAAAKDNSVDVKLAALSARVEDLQKSLAQATQQLSQVSAKLSADASTTNPGLDERLNKIEQKLNQTQPSSKLAAVVASDTGAEVMPTVYKSHAHKTHVKKVSYIHTKKPLHKAVSHEKEAAVDAPHWVLRAATPDEAWVATDANSPELRHVQIGDTLAGIGTVQAIHQNGDKWVLQGSSGTLQ